jgi:GPI mannosyltransferase 2
MATTGPARCALGSVCLLLTATTGGRRPWAAAVAVGAAGLVRSNGVLLAGFFAYDGLVAWARAPRWGHAARVLVRTAALGAVACAPMLAMQWHAYRAYCVDAPPHVARPWCGATVPLLYSFVQAHYWYVIA